MSETASRTRSSLVIGASSSIGAAVCHELAGPETHLLLAGRTPAELERLAADLRLRHECRVDVRKFEALDFDEHAAWAQDWCQALGGPPEEVVVCHGLPDDLEKEADPVAARAVLDVNLTSVVSILTPISQEMAAAGRGWIAAISSVAGDRGRQSNYLYGAAKGGLSTYLQGLRNRLMASNVHVMTVKPGFVDTPMLRSQMPDGSPLAATPERVAKAIVRAGRRGRNVLYTPWFWRPIMFLIGLIPEWLFKRMKL